MLTAKDYEVMDQLKKLPQYEELKAVENEDITYFVEKHNALRTASMNNSIRLLIFPSLEIL